MLLREKSRIPGSWLPPYSGQQTVPPAAVSSAHCCPSSRGTHLRRPACAMALRPTLAQLALPKVWSGSWQRCGRSWHRVVVGWTDCWRIRRRCGPRLRVFASPRAGRGPGQQAFGFEETDMRHIGCDALLFACQWGHRFVDESVIWKGVLTYLEFASDGPLPAATF